MIQARKFKLGVTLAHQFLDQLKPELRASVMTNPAIRFAGGVSRKDANALDSDMRTTNDFLMAMRKRENATEFACYIRNATPAAVKLSIPLGSAEGEPTMSEAAYETLLARSRAMVAEPLATTAAPTPPATQAAVATPVAAPAIDPSKAGEW